MTISTASVPKTVLQKNIGSVTLPLGQSPWGRYLVEMQAVFVALPLIIANIARMSPDRTAVEFGVGAASLTSTALLIGVARRIQTVLNEGGIVDTMVHGISLPLRELPGGRFAVELFFVQSLANFFIPSGSGQAYVTVPIMAPLEHLALVAVLIGYVCERHETISRRYHSQRSRLMARYRSAPVPSAEMPSGIPYILSNELAGAV